MFFIAYFVGWKMNASIITTCIQLVVGVFSYSILLLIFKDEMLFEFLDKLKNRR